MNQSHSRNDRDGTVYVAVLGVAMIIGVMAVGAMAVQRTERHIVARQQNLAKARLNALAGIEMGRLRVQQDVGWRTTYPNGIWEQDIALTDGTYTLAGIDPADGDLTNDELQAVTLTATGTSGNAVQNIQATFQPEVVPFNSLEVAVVGGSVDFGAANVTCDQIIASNDWMWAFFASVHGNVEAAKWIAGWSYLGTKTDYVPTRDLPDPNTVFDYYVTHGTAIDIHDLAKTADHYDIDKSLLSANENPYGTGQTNAEGIYVIDCLGFNVRVENSRIAATLVLLNAGADSRLELEVNWAPAVANYPALLVQGDITVNIESNVQLDEKVINKNLNPVGTPYAGVEDTDKKDKYPTEIQGMVYVSGDCTWKNQSSIIGVLLVAGALKTADQPSITYSSLYHDSPPPGFYTLPLSPVPGSWRQVVN